jgi:DNA mismatch repair protein MutS
VIDRAKEILSNLERGELDAMGMPKIAKTKMAASKVQAPLQPSLFYQPDPIRSQLKKMKVDQLTPLEALNALDDLKKKVEQEE